MSIHDIEYNNISKFKEFSSWMGPVGTSTDCTAGGGGYTLESFLRNCVKRKKGRIQEIRQEKHGEHEKHEARDKFFH